MLVSLAARVGSERLLIRGAFRSRSISWVYLAVDMTGAWSIWRVVGLWEEPESESEVDEVERRGGGGSEVRRVRVFVVVMGVSSAG